MKINTDISLRYVKNTQEKGPKVPRFLLKIQPKKKKGGGDPQVPRLMWVQPLKNGEVTETQTIQKPTAIITV